MESKQSKRLLLPLGWVSVADAARGLGVHEATLFRWAREGVAGHRLRLIKVGGRTGVCASDVEAFVLAVSSQPRGRRRRPSKAGPRA